MAKEILNTIKSPKVWKPLDAFYLNNKEYFDIYSRETFLQIFYYELKRSARKKSHLSLLIISFNESRYKTQYIKSIITLIKKNIRIIDHLGWCGTDKLAILLPCTDYHGTELLMNKIKSSREYFSELCEITIKSSNSQEDFFINDELAK